MLHESKKVSVYTGDLALAAVGGFGCGYSDDTIGHPGSYPPTSLISVVVVPSAIGEPSERAASLARPLCGPDSVPDAPDGDGSNCAATDTVAGWWYSLSVTNDSESGSRKPQSAFALIEAALQKALKGVRAPERAAVAEPFDCATASTPDAPLIGSRVIADDLLGPEDTSPNPDPFQPPTDQEILAAAYLVAGPTTCFTSSEGWSITVYPGGASAYAQCVQGLGTVSTTTNPEVKSAFANINYALGGTEICATNGKSTVTATSLVHDDGQPWTAKVLHGLGALLVRVFSGSASLGAPWTPSLPAPVAPDAVQPLVDGACARLLDASAAATTLGEPNVRNPAAAGDPTLAAVGGLDCQYVLAKPGSTDDVAVVTAAVAPSAIADPDELKASLAPPACDSGIAVATCTATVAVDGWWYSLQADMNVGGAAKAAPIAKFAAIAANLERTLKSAPAPGRVIVTEPFDCESIDTAGAPVVRSRALPGSRFWAGYWEGDDSDIRAAAFLLAGPVTCVFPSPDDVPWYLTVYPGSSSAFPQCTHSGADAPETVVSVPGVKSAILVSSGASGVHVCATDGKNTVLAVSDVDLPLTEAEQGTFSSLLAPVFAALK
jgi:hypothetical protein